MRLPRGSGILLHPTSLPGPFGIGDIGPSAYEFVDFLSDNGQRWWQMLPLGPIGKGHSPYQSPSSFAGNRYLISPEMLAADGLLRAEDLNDYPRLPEDHVEFERMMPAKERLLRLAFLRWDSSDHEFAEYQRNNLHWIEDYALFAALQCAHPELSWPSWGPELARREPEAMASQRERFSEETLFVKFVEYQFDKQFRRLRKHCESRSIGLIGDLPIFVAFDSADVWARPDLFLLDEWGQPTVVAGVPPDQFAEEGQLWGNPLYRWDAHRADGFQWWIDRLRATLQRTDLVRLDHFRGFESYWEVPFGAPNARDGCWKPSPGEELLSRMREALGGFLPMIAEDLGLITPPVESLRDQFHLPGMKVLQFGFGDPGAAMYLPYSYNNHCVAYTGTHDNDTTRGWFTTRPEKDSELGAWERERRFVRRFTQPETHEIHWEFIRLAHSSVADTSIIPLQDVMGLGSEARMNVPGTPTGNWRWRFRDCELRAEQRERLAEMTAVYGRWNGSTSRNFS